MASKIVQRLGRLVGLDTAGKDVPAELDTELMGQALVMIAGIDGGLRRVVPVGRVGELISTTGLGAASRIETREVASVVAAWTPFAASALVVGQILGCVFYATTPTVFAMVGGPGPGEYVIIGPGVEVDSFIPFKWPAWTVQPHPLGAGAIAACAIHLFWRG